MLQALLVTFREGLESFLVVGVVAGYLRKTGRADLMRGVRAGVALSALTCLGGAWLWLSVPNQPLYEGIAALAAAGFVGLLLWQTVRSGRRLKGEIERRVARAVEGVSSRTGWAALLGVAAVTTLLVTREGLEAVFYLGVQVLAAKASADRLQAALLAGGALAGLLLAATVAWGWTRFAHRLNLGAVLKVTALFLGLFLLQLLVYGVHELAESGVIGGSQAFHDATERFGPDGPIGHAVSYSLLAAPLLYLLWARRDRLARASTPAPSR